MNRMMMRRHLLATGLLLLHTVAVARPMEMASFRKLFRSPNELGTEVASDNIKECAPSVRRSIVRTKNEWGIFHFACNNGVVRNVFVHPKSLINTNPESFITKNLGLFDLQGSSITVTFDGDTGVQTYGGKIVDEAVIYRVTRKGDIPTPESQVGVQPISTRDLERAAGVVKGEYVIFEIRLIDPEDDSLPPHPGIKGPQ